MALMMDFREVGDFRLWYLLPTCILMIKYLKLALIYSRPDSHSMPNLKDHQASLVYNGDRRWYNMFSRVKNRPHQELKRFKIISIG